jgi:protein-S-isoprenylcysteine O-methyltransferase Ste14
MFVLVRAVTYATLFVGLLLVFLPARIVEWSGLARPASLGPLGLAGIVVGAAGAVLALWCIATFALVGKGTPAPFDPPRRLVVRGPYRHVRNPMYLGAGLALGGAALVYRSVALLIYIGAFLAAAHLFVRAYEEPTLARHFGDEYRAYRTRVRRWLPRIRQARADGQTG